MGCGRCRAAGTALSVGLLPLLQPLREVEDLAGTVQPVLDELALRFGLTAKVSVRQGDFAVTAARCALPQATSVAVRIGASFHLALASGSNWPACCTPRRRFLQ